MKEKPGKSDEILCAAIAAGSSESVSLHGTANAEFWKAYSGFDHQTGQSLKRSHQKIFRYRSPGTDKVIKQQAGFSAETAYTARQNSKAILNGDRVRVSQTDDVPGFGTNHTVWDHVQILDGVPVEGAGSQMKFVSDYKGLLQKIAKGHGGGKNDLSRYQGNALQLPSNQVQEAKRFCAEEATKLHRQAEKTEALGKVDVSRKLRKDAKNFERLRDDIVDSGITSEEAISYRLSPKWETAKDIGRISHQAGLEGAKLGAVMGGSIAIITNLIMVATGEKTKPEAVRDIGIVTGKAAAIGYVTGLSGSALSGMMQQSARGTVRSIANSNLPAMVISTCVSLSGSIRSLVNGEIDLLEFLEDVGQTGVNTLTAGAFATAGQIAIPIPVVGALAGGMIGYMLSSAFYKESLMAFKAAHASDQRYKEIKSFCEESRARINEEKRYLEIYFSEQLKVRKDSSAKLFESLDQASLNEDADDFCYRINAYAARLGHNLEVETKGDFDNMMASGQTIKI